MNKIRPRDTLPGTRAEGQIQRGLFAAYVRAYVLDGEDKEIGSAAEVFEVEFLSVLRSRLSEEALSTPVIFTEKLSNRVLGILASASRTKRVIAINARFKIDPETLVYTLVEEFVHSQQVLDDIDIADQKRSFEYENRPYEQQAKKLAAELMGYPPEDYEIFLRREEPDGILYD